MKKIITIFILLFIVFATASCEAYPVENQIIIKVEENVLSWNEYPSALSYNIYIDNVLTQTITDTKYELKLKEGSYRLKVNAKTQVGYSSFSNVLVYYSDGSLYQEEAIKLLAPKIKLEENILSWNKVSQAESYLVYLNNELLEETTSLQLEISLNQNDEYYVVAKAGKFISENSNVIKVNTLDKDFGTVNIFSINDTHGAIVTNNSVTGMEKVATLIDTLEKDTDYIKVANGDIFQGGYASNVTRGRIFIDVLNAMDFDCFVIGNHEFDWGIETISLYNDGDESNGEADFPFLGANIVYKSSSTMPDWLEQYTIIENNGLKVGIIGVIGQELTSSISAEYVKDYTFLDPVPIVEKLSSTLRTEEKCDVVIVSIHEYEESTNKRFAALSGDSKVDAILCAHTHQRINETVSRSDGYQIPVLQSNTKNITVGTLNLEVENGLIDKISTKHYYPSDYAQSSSILNVINNYKDVIDEGTKVVGYTSSSMSKSKLGNLAANSMVEYTNADFACLNTGGVRATINAGDILMEEILEVFPFDNNLIIVEMTGSKLKSFYNDADGYLYFSSNLNTSSLSNNQIYKVCVIDYVYTYYYYQKHFNGLKATELDEYIRDAVVYGIENGI